MLSDSFCESDPFADPASVGEREAGLVADSTLHVGRTANLTLGTDALIVLDESLPRKSSFRCCCDLLLTRSAPTYSIPFFNILWATTTKVDLTIHYAKSTSSSTPSPVQVAFLNYPLDPSSTAAFAAASSWTSRLLDRAYGRAKRKKRIKILINPFGGAGRAVKIYQKQIEPIFAAARCEIDVERTEYRGHAVEIAENLNVDAYDVVAAASGDGVVYEIFNGLAKKQNATEALQKTAVVQLPCGTGNAMSWNLNGTDIPSLAALAIVKGLRTPLDLASVTQGERRIISFLSQSIGIVADSDLGTENIRWMGDARFTYGFLVRLLEKRKWPCDIAVKTEIENKNDIKRHYAKEIAKRKGGSIPSDAATTSLEPSPSGLPALRHGTILDPIPSDWSPLTPFPALGNFYAGNMAIMTEDAPFFPASLPDDGMLDLVTISAEIPRLKSVGLLFSIPKGAFFDDDVVRVRKVVAYRVVPRFGKCAPTAARTSPARSSKAQNPLQTFLHTIAIASRKRDSEGEGFISIDGEKVPFEPFQVEVHHALGTTLSRTGVLYETPGPRGWERFTTDPEVVEIDRESQTVETEQ